MALREKFGRLVLLEETESEPLGDEYRAARLGPAGLDRLVSVLRFSPAVSGARRGLEAARGRGPARGAVQNPGLVRVLGVGRVDQSFYVSTELVEGRTVRAVLGLCREEGFPFAVDHALMIASRAAVGLEYLHGRKDENGRPLVHGLLTPRRLVVAFDGEVKVKGLGLWPAFGGTELLRRRSERISRRSRPRARASRAPTSTRSGWCCWRRSAASRRTAATRSGKSPPPASRAPAASRPVAQAARRAAAPRARPRAGGALRRRRRDAQGDRRASVLRRLQPDHLRPRLLHAHAVPRRGREGGAGDRGGACAPTTGSS